MFQLLIIHVPLNFGLCFFVTIIFLIMQKKICNTRLNVILKYHFAHHVFESRYLINSKCFNSWNLGYNTNCMKQFVTGKQRI